MPAARSKSSPGVRSVTDTGFSPMRISSGSSIATTSSSVRLASPSTRVICAMAPLYTRRAMLAELLLKWPLIRQLRGDGDAAVSDRTRALRKKNERTEVARSICPYCGVGCGQLVYHRGGRVVSIEGDPESPISRGHLCPKGAASYELVTHPARMTKVLYRAPRSRKWTELPLDQAMRMVARRMWETRARTFTETLDGKPVM